VWSTLLACWQSPAQYQQSQVPIAGESCGQYIDWEGDAAAGRMCLTAVPRMPRCADRPLSHPFSTCNCHSARVIAIHVHAELHVKYQYKHTHASGAASQAQVVMAQCIRPQTAQCSLWNCPTHPHPVHAYVTIIVGCPSAAPAPHHLHQHSSPQPLHLVTCSSLELPPPG
jgi:hypothetical protein